MNRKPLNRRKMTGALLGGALILWGLLGCPASLRADDNQVGLEMEVDKRQVEVGDTLTVTLDFKQTGSGNSMVIQDPSIPTPEHFEIRGTSSSTRLVMMNQQMYQVSTTQFTLVATQPGQETLGPASMIYQDAKFGKRELQSNGTLVTVVAKSAFSLFGNSSPAPTAAPAAPPPDQLRDVKPLLPESFAFLGWIILFLIILLTAGLIYRRSRRSEKKTISIPESEEDRFKSALKKLFAEDLPAKEFCLRLASLVRECLQVRYDFPAADYTTGEIVKTLKQKNAPEDVREAAEKCLKTCDRVVYADGNLSAKENLRALALLLLPKTQKRNK